MGRRRSGLRAREELHRLHQIKAIAERRCAARASRRPGLTPGEHSLYEGEENRVRPGARGDCRVVHETIHPVCVSFSGPAPPSWTGQLQGEGRELLLDGVGLGAGWRAADGKPLEWFTTAAVSAAGAADEAEGCSRAARLWSTAPPGRRRTWSQRKSSVTWNCTWSLWFPRNRTPASTCRDCTRSRVKDSYGVKDVTSHDCGGIYERWINNKGVGGPRRCTTRPSRRANGKASISASRRPASTPKDTKRRMRSSCK